MKQSILSHEEIRCLETYDTPTLANALERFELRGRTEGVADESIRQIIPYSKTFIGYVCTAVISASEPAKGDNRPLARRYFQQFHAFDGPTIAVIQDIDKKPVGSFWGEVNATVHKALGCVATVTNGGVRDLREVKTLGFGYYAKEVLVTHGYVHFEDCCCPVTIGNLQVNPGDLIAADEHGVLLIPEEAAKDLLQACRLTAMAETPILEGSRRAILAGEKPTVDEVMDWRESMYRLRKSHC